MLRSHREVVAAGLGVSVGTHALLHARYRLHAVRNVGVVCDDDVALKSFARRGHVGRPIATVLLEGAACLRDAERTDWLAPGDVVALAAKGGVSMRQEGPRYAALAFEWDPEWLGPRPRERIRGSAPAPARAALGASFEAIVRGSGGAADVLAVVDALRDAGVPLRRPTAEECVEEVPAQTIALSRTLDALLSRLDEQPMVADLERDVGASARHLNRLVTAFNERYGFNAGNWRDARNRRRLLVGVALMTAGGATAHGVARLVGYQSLPAFSSALRKAGFPPPSEIAAIVASLAPPRVAAVGAATG